MLITNSSYETQEKIASVHIFRLNGIFYFKNRNIYQSNINKGNKYSKYVNIYYDFLRYRRNMQKYSAVIFFSGEKIIMQ